MNIRYMNEEDLEKVITIDKIVFEKMTNENRTTKVKINGRNIDILSSYLEESYGKSIIVEEDGQIVGYLFTHIWGENAWIGPLGVAPNFQNKGIAKLMLEKAIYEIRSINILNITLETMPEKTKNIGLYLKSGFNSHCLRFRMEKNNIEPKEYKLLMNM